MTHCAFCFSMGFTSCVYIGGCWHAKEKQLQKRGTAARSFSSERENRLLSFIKSATQITQM